MATVFENRPAPAYTPPQEDAALHNALIKERYEKLKNAEATQLAESISEAERAPYAAPRAAASVLAPERPEKTAPAFTAPGSRKDSSRERSRTHQSGFPAVHARNAGQDDSGELL